SPAVFELAESGEALLITALRRGVVALSEGDIAQSVEGRCASANIAERLKGLQGLFVRGARGRVVTLRFRDVRQVAQRQDRGLAPPDLLPQRHRLFDERPRLGNVAQPHMVDGPAVQKRSDSGFVAELAIDLQTLFGKP